MTKPTKRPSRPDIAYALRVLRTRAGLTQTAVSKREGAPDFRTLSHWETRRKLPSLRLLLSYLSALGLDLHDLQNALDLANGGGITDAARLDDLGRQVAHLQTAHNGLTARLDAIEGQGGAT